jgi:nicotinamide mononucleotide transporter
VNWTEIGANTFVATAIFLAARNSIHTWWTGIVGCALFAAVFFGAKLYADVTLQVFFIVTSVYGWRRWLRGRAGGELPVRFSPPRLLLGSGAAAALVALGYGWLLFTFTDAFAPFLDSVVLAFSVLGQLLMMDRRVENWWAWLLVNTIAAPLYASRGLYVTSALYAAFWINAVVALRRWRAIAERPADSRS